MPSPTTVRGLFACNQPACLTPARLISKIFVLTGDIGGQGRGGERRGRGRWTQDPEGRRVWGCRNRGEKQGRRGGNAQGVGGGEEEDSGDGNNGGTGERETKRDRGHTGKQQQISGEVLSGWDRPGGERRRKHRVEWRGDGGVGNGGGG